jgi:four helix bundle suffix protein
LRELQEDYEDYMRTRSRAIWEKDNPRAVKLKAFCRTIKKPDDYCHLLQKMSDEELGNFALTLIHQARHLMLQYLQMLEHRFLNEGGISENMAQARMQHRKGNW